MTLFTNYFDFSVVSASDLCGILAHYTWIFDPNPNNAQMNIKFIMARAWWHENPILYIYTGGWDYRYSGDSKNLQCWVLKDKRGSQTQVKFLHTLSLHMEAYSLSIQGCIFARDQFYIGGKKHCSLPPERKENIYLKILWT